ncbi:MAG TPA: class I SAM-dependent methyltransferase [Ktedonobacterales bacterium]|nr:class I SAM-dependent methyltransferase [Ktedonobacterales bacterium]
MRWFGWIRRKRVNGEADAMDSAFSVVGGRTRTRGIPYAMPHDLEETNRLDFQHYLLRYALRGNYAAPIREPRDILDVGAGTGRWALEMAQLFPGANVIGLDVNPLPIDEAAEAGKRADPRPPNYAFVPGNVLEGLPFADHSFDFVHMRLLIMAIPHDRWPFVVNELIRVTRLGGWVESVETTILQNGGPAMKQIIGWSTAILGRRGVDLMDGERVGDLLRAGRLEHVTMEPVMLPCGEYGGRIGKMLAADYISGAKGLGGLAATLGMTTPEQFQQTLTANAAEFAAPRGRCVVPFYVSYGQRMA